jgi:predicted Na+-dependent transporter
MERRRPDAFLFSGSLIVLLVTLSLAYVWDILDTFRGSSLVYLGWLLLVIGAILSEKSEGRRRGKTWTAVKYIALIAGLVIIAFAFALGFWFDKTLDWIPLG